MNTSKSNVAQVRESILGNRKTLVLSLHMKPLLAE